MCSGTLCPGTRHPLDDPAKAFTMHLRRTLALATGALVLSTLTSCGTAATGQVNTIGNGVDNRDASVDVLNAIVVSTDAGSGTFIASFSNNSLEEPTSFTTLEGIDQGALSAEEFTAIDIPAGGFVSLADEGGVPVTGDFEAGNFVEVSVQFDNGEQVELEIPVVTNCEEYEGLDEGTADCEPEHDSAGH